jgi:mannose-6-phosphate isomerase-like protein (cupin superfamily)
MKAVILAGGLGAQISEETYIPIGAPHWLETLGKMPLEMFEVQSGSYLGEVDIVRLDDTYRRVEA